MDMGVKEVKGAKEVKGQLLEQVIQFSRNKGIVLSLL